MKLPLLAIFFWLFQVLLQGQSTDYLEIGAGAGVHSSGQSQGISFADYNNDGFADIYINKAGSANVLLRNNGDLTFTEVASQAGVDFQPGSYAAGWGDINNDGFVDLYLGSSVNNVLYLNNGNGTFTDITTGAGVGHFEKPNAVNMADVDNDGFLDIYLSHPRQENVLYHNNGDGTFTDIILESGAVDDGFSMGTVFFDYDNDHDLDLYLVHDGNEANILYRNNGSGIFTDVTAAAGVGYEGQGMGVDFGDINNDGYLDLYITNLYENVLYRNNGDGTFSNVAATAGVDDFGMGWGVAWLDYNNDGLQDIYIANESNFSPYPNVLYKNLGNESFEIVSAASPLNSPQSGFGLACSDINNDGGMDIFVTNRSEYHSDELFLNNAVTKNWITLQCKGKISNSSAIGAKVEVTTGEVTQTDIVTSGSGYASQNSHSLHFGLSDHTQVDRLTVYWPSGKVDQYDDVPANHRYLARESESLQGNLENLDVLTAVPDNTVRLGDLKSYPNPFTERTDLEFFLDRSGLVDLAVFDLRGQKVSQLISGPLGAGEHHISWDIREWGHSSLTEGIYICRLKAGNSVKIHKLLKL